MTALPYAEQIGPGGGYRVTVYAKDVTGRELEGVQALTLNAVGRYIAQAFERWADRGQEIHIIVMRWDQ